MLTKADFDEFYLDGPALLLITARREDGAFDLAYGGFAILHRHERYEPVIKWSPVNDCGGEEVFTLEDYSKGQRLYIVDGDDVCDELEALTGRPLMIYGDRKGHL